MKTIKVGPFEIPVIVTESIPPDEWGLVTAEQKPGGEMVVYWNNGEIWRGRVAASFSMLEGKVSFGLKVSKAP